MCKAPNQVNPTYMYVGFSEAEKELIECSEHLGVDLVGLRAADKLGDVSAGHPWPT